jgi:hypothetical protein
MSRYRDLPLEATNLTGSDIDMVCLSPGIMARRHALSASRIFSGAICAPPGAVRAPVPAISRWFQKSMLDF